MQHHCHNAVDTSQGDGEAHINPASQSAMRNQGHGASREVQMSTRPSFETEVEQSEQEPVEVRQLCAWEQETVLTTSGKRPKTHHPSAPFLSSKVFSQL